MFDFPFKYLGYIFILILLISIFMIIILTYTGFLILKYNSKNQGEIDIIYNYLLKNNNILIDLKKNNEEVKNNLSNLNNQRGEFFKQIDLLNKKLIKIGSELTTINENENKKVFIDLIDIINNIYPMIYNLKDSEKTLILKTLNIIEEIFSESKKLKIIKPNLLQKFNPNEHEIVDFVVTNTCEKENKISEILGIGYYWKGKLEKKAKVQLYKCKTFDEK